MYALLKYESDKAIEKALKDANSWIEDDYYADNSPVSTPDFTQTVGRYTTGTGLSAHPRKQDFDTDASRYGKSNNRAGVVGWTSCAGNRIEYRFNDVSSSSSGYLIVEIRSKRHGIPSRALQDVKEDPEVLVYDTQEPTWSPWDTADDID